MQEMRICSILLGRITMDDWNSTQMMIVLLLPISEAERQAMHGSIASFGIRQNPRVHIVRAYVFFS